MENEKLQRSDDESETDFGFDYYRSISSPEHRSIHSSVKRSIDFDECRSIDLEETSHECSAVKIMSHEAFAARHPHPPVPIEVDSHDIDRHDDSPIDRHEDPDIDRHTPVIVARYTVPQRRVQLPKIDSALIDALREQYYTSRSPPTDTMKKPTDILEPMELEKENQGRVLRKRKEKIPKPYKREANEKELSSFRKRVLRIPKEKPFEEAYFTHRLWMFFRETKETEEDIRRMFNQVRDSMKKRITLEKKSDPGKFTIPCSVRGVEFPRALCDTGSGVSILPKIMADHLGLKIEPTEESFIFVDCSQQNSGGIVRNLEVRIGDALIPTDFHVLDVKLNFKTSLLLGRAFLATVGAVCDLKSNKLCLTLIDPTIYYDPVHVIKFPRRESSAFVAACFCAHEYDSMAEYETEQDVSTDTSHLPSTDTSQPTSTDDTTFSSIDMLLREIEEEFPEDDFEANSWENDYYIPALAIDTTHREEEYDEDYEEERAIEYRFLQEDEERPPQPTFIFGASIDRDNSPSTDMPQPRSLKRHFQPSSDTTNFVSIYTPQDDTRDGNYSIGSWASNYHESFAVDTAPLKHSTQPEEVSSTDPAKHQSIDSSTLPSTDTPAKPSIDITTTPSEVQAPNIDFGYLTPDEFGIFRDPDGHARAMDGRIIPISKDDIADILLMANGSVNLFTQQPIYIEDKHHQQHIKETSAKQDGEEVDHLNSEDPDFLRASIDTKPNTSIDIRREFGKRAFKFGVRRFFWEKKDEYGVYRDESGFARGENGDIINVSKEDIRKLLHRASMMERSCLCLPEHAEQFAKGDPVCKLYTQAEVTSMINKRISDLIWEKGGMQFEHEKALSSLRGDIHWIEGCNKSITKKNEALQEEVNALRLELKSHKTLSTDTGTAPSIDTSSSQPITYTKKEIDELITNIYQDLEKTEERNSQALEDKCHTLNNTNIYLRERINNITETMDTTIDTQHHNEETMRSIYNHTRMIIDEMFKPIQDRLQEVEKEQRKLFTQKLDESHLKEKSIDRPTGTSIDKEEFCTRAELDTTTEEIYRAIEDTGDEAYRQLDQTYFPINNAVETLQSRTEEIQKEIKTIQRQLANRPAPLASIDMPPSTSTDRQPSGSTDMKVTRSTDISSYRMKTIQRINAMQDQLSDLSDHAYSKISSHDFHIESLEGWLQRINEELQELKDRMTRRDEATRSFFTSWFEEKHDKKDTCFPTSTCNSPH